jgi:hypothetical protein
MSFSAMLAIGSLTAALSFFGCMGSWAKSRVLLIIYGLLVVGLLAGQVTVGGTVFSATQNSQVISNTTLAAWTNSLDTGRNFLQTEFKCCGYTGPDDNAGSQCNPVYEKVGCAPYLNAQLKSTLQNTAKVSLIVGCIQAGAIIMAIILIRDEGVRSGFYSKGY